MTDSTKTKLVGDKCQFAIEYFLVDKVSICIRLWIDSLPIGSIEDQVMLGTIIAQVKRLLNWPKISTLSHNEKLLIGDMEFIKAHFLDEKLIPHARTGFPENFDDFIFQCIRIDSSYIFVWRIVNEPYFQHDGYPTLPQIASIPESMVSHVANNFLKEVE